MKKNPGFLPFLLTTFLIVHGTFIRAQVTSLTSTENAVKGLFKKKSKPAKVDSTQTGAGGSGNAVAGGGANGAAAGANGAAAGPLTLTAYANYDFVPGEQVVFEDHFADDQDGEFPEHWKLEKGQGIINKVQGEQAFFLTEGNYVRVAPRMKTEKAYLPENFTIEFDFYHPDGAYQPTLLFSTNDDQSRNISFGTEVGTGYFPNDFSAPFPGDKDHFDGKWHHAAMIKKGNQVKCYEDQYRVLVIPIAAVVR